MEQIYFSQHQSKEKNGKAGRIKFYAWAGILGLLVILIMYSVAISQIFKVKVDVVGIQRLSEERLFQSLAGKIFKNRLAGFLGLDNYLAWPKKIQLNEPLIAQLTIQKNLLEKKIILTVEERQPYGIWCVKKSCYWFDKEGVIFEEAPISEGHLILRVDSNAESLPVLGNIATNSDFYEIIQKIFIFFETADLKVEKYKFKNELQEFHAQITNGPEIRFSLRFDPKSSLEALNILIQKNSWKNASYIDLTVENRVYLK